MYLESSSKGFKEFSLPGKRLRRGNKMKGHFKDMRVRRGKTEDEEAQKRTRER